VLCEAGSLLAFRHELVREALYTDLPLPIRTGLHLEVGRALASAGAPAIQVAEHLALGASAGDHQAVAWLHQAARQAQPAAPGVAAHLLERALQIASPDDAARDILAADLVMARLWSGRPAEAEVAARQALARGRDPAVEAMLRLGLIEALLAQGKALAAGHEAEAALARPGPAGPAQVRLLAEAAFGLIYAADLEGGARAAGAALRASEQVGDDLAACIALCALCVVAVHEGRLPAGLAHAAAAVDRAERSADRAAAGFHSNLFLGWTLSLAEQPVEAQDALRRGRQLSEERGMVLSLPLYQWALAWAHFFAGNWDDCIAEAEAGLELAEEVATWAGVVGTHSVLAMIALRRNDRAGSDNAVERAVASLVATGYDPFAEFASWARALVEEARGDCEAARATLAAAWDACTAGGNVNERPFLGPDLVRLLVAGGESAEARAVAHQVEEAALAIGTRAARAAALRCRGLAESDVAALLDAVRLLRAAPRPLELALACEEAAALLVSVRHTDEAAALLDEALDAYGRLEATRDLARVRSALRRLGRHPRHRGWQRRRARTGWASLTRTELAVAGLVGQGLTNREVAQHLFISPRTVETHLSHVFAKLGLSSRAELRAEVARQGSRLGVSHPDRPS
jgi:DNA-binding CsgD family transcriptional regulator